MQKGVDAALIGPTTATPAKWARCWLQQEGVTLLVTLRLPDALKLQTPH